MVSGHEVGSDRVFLPEQGVEDAESSLYQTGNPRWKVGRECLNLDPIVEMLRL